MNAILNKPGKFLNLLNANISKNITNTAAFVRIIPTDFCNLDCKYCWQRNKDPYSMKFEDFRNYIDKAITLKTGVVSFLGGEPLLWEHIYDAIALCSQKKLITDLTTNGTLLDADSIERLGRAGLDYLNISVDGVKRDGVSSKNSIFRKNVLKDLKKIRKKYHTHIRINSVIYNNNFEQTKELIEFSKLNNIKISLGFIVPPIEYKQYGSQYFTKENAPLLGELVSHIIAKKRERYPIIDPEAYFLNIFRFLDKEKFWDCNYPTKYGWINVSPRGKIRSCTKKMDEMDIDFLSLNSEKIAEMRVALSRKVSECNQSCYSNCAYDSYYFRHNKGELFKKAIPRKKNILYKV